MTIWSPQTCACIIETNNDNKWVKTIKKCYLHEGYTGKTLLEEVLKYNRENSPKGEPDTIEGEFGFDFEPNWTLEVRKSPSIEKLAETRFNLEALKLQTPDSREFQFCLSNFLNSSTSVLWYLLEEYSRKFGFDINKYRNDEKYRKAHETSVSGDANSFLAWYDTEFRILQSEKEGFLLDKRNNNIHQGYITLVYKVRQPFKVTGKQNVNLPVDWSKLSAYFPENQNIKAIDMCTSFVSQLQLLVDKAHGKFSVMISTNAS